MISDAKRLEIVNKANNRATNSGRYAYKVVLGEGSFGSVLQATDKSTDEDVAVKIIKAKKSVIEQILFFKTSASIKQGRKEALILTDLQHQNITAIRDHFKFRKSAFKSGLAIVTGPPEPVRLVRPKPDHFFFSTLSWVMVVYFIYRMVKIVR